MSPALAGGFLTTGPPGKSYLYLFYDCYSCDLVLQRNINILPRLKNGCPCPLALSTRTQTSGLHRAVDYRGAKLQELVALMGEGDGAT